MAELNNDDMKKLIRRVFGTDEGKMLLDILYKKNVHTDIAITENLLDIGKRQGRATMIRQFKDIMGE